MNRKEGYKRKTIEPSIDSREESIDKSMTEGCAQIEKSIQRVSAETEDLTKETSAQEEKPKSFLGRYQKKKKEIAKKLWFRILNQCLNWILALGAVLPMMYYLCTSIPFTYEVNDDTVIAQILDGSYTGMPNAHAIFVKYPLSWIMKTLYEINPKIQVGDLLLENVNWYVGTIVLLMGFALVVVLYRMLAYLACNRFIICLVYDVAFLYVWMPCLMRLTFSTAAAFMGCAAVLYLALEREEEAWRPWNLVILAILMIASYCLRTQSFYMVAPFLAVEFALKYHIHFFQSWKPWFAVVILALLCGGAYYCNSQAYGSKEWKDFYRYNHARAYMQDYVGFPDYEQEEVFYQEIGMTEKERDAVAQYSYCLLDGFETRWVEEMYQHIRAQEPVLTWKEKIEGAKEQALKYLLESKQAPKNLRYSGIYLWFVAVLLLPVTFLLRWKGGFPSHLLYLLETIAYGLLMAAEWVYLAIKGRFPQRVEESIRLLMVTAALVLILHLLERYREVWMCRIHGILQLFVIALILLPLLTPQIQGMLKDTRDAQEARLAYGADKAEVLAYCGKWPENIYILDTRSFTKASLPSDDLHQNNWIMGASWTAYSPLFDEKLKNFDTDNLASEFLQRENVYIVTRGKKNIGSMLGLENDQVTAEVVDEFCSSGNTFFEIYKIRDVRK